MSAAEGDDIMSKEFNKACIQRFFEEVVCQGNLETVDKLLSASCRYFDAGILNTSSVGEFKDYLVQARKPFDSINIKIDSLIAEDYSVAVRYSYHSVLAGEPVVVPAMAEFHIKDGKIVEMWRYLAATN